jgi:DNA-binding FadR family transcriptional regulator
MKDADDLQRIAWTTRITVRPSVREAFNRMAKQEMVSIAHLIGNAMTEYLTARSS